MKNRSVFLILMFFLIPLSLLVVGKTSGAVSAVSNESVIEGVVSEYTIISSHLIGIKPERVLYGLTIHIGSSRNTGDGPDFLHNRNGEDIRFYSREKLSPDLFGRKIKAKAVYKGDGKRGIYWISDIEIIK